MENDFFADYIFPFLPFITPFASAYLGYFLGIRSKRSEIVIKRELELLEEIGTSIQKVFSEYQYFIWFFSHNYSHISIEQGVIAIKKDVQLYDDMVNKVKANEELLAELRNKILPARLYLDKKLIEYIDEYLESAKFIVTISGYGEENYFENFFGNLLDEENNNKRINLERKIIKRLSKSV